MKGAGITALPSPARPAVAWPAVLMVYAAALLQGMTLVSYPAVSAVLKQALALTDADYGAIFLPLIGLGLAIGPLIAGAFAAAGAWSGFPALLAGACTIAAIAALLIRLPQPSTIPAGEETAATRPAASLGFWLFAAITVIYAFAEGTFSSWAVIFLRDTKGLPGMTASYALSAFWGALVAGRLLVSVLILRVPARLVWIALPVLMIAAFWLVSLADSAATGIGAFALAGLACSAFLPLTISLAADRFPDSVAWVSSMLIAVLMTGVGVGTWMVGALQAALPLEMLYRLSSLYPILVLALAWPAIRSSRRDGRKRPDFASA